MAIKTLLFGSLNATHLGILDANFGSIDVTESWGEQDHKSNGR